MLSNKKILAAAGAGLALFAAYKYTRLSSDQKKELQHSLKRKGKTIAEKLMPGKLKSKVNMEEQSLSTGY
ncbi:MAG: hypothetical protein JSU03_01450 [Bacteroidetes bacterium]|nr:hypothetical protein [Bacteroidota bacterium]MBS1755920.1 hypothetical protein [Bacteroidota bacterium]